MDDRWENKTERERTINPHTPPGLNRGILPKFPWPLRYELVMLMSPKFFEVILVSAFSQEPGKGNQRDRERVSTTAQARAAILGLEGEMFY